MNKNTILLILGTIITAIILSMINTINNLEDELLTVEENNKAYQKEVTILEGNSNMYKLTIEQLEYFNDSITNKLKEAKEQLKIKDKNLKQLQYINANTSKTDTIIMRDTIFKDNLNIDTTLQDRWYNLSLSLKYPGTIIVNPTFNNETMIFVSSKKETIKPPKKWWIQRIFQKKHTVINIDVVENNPYTNVKNQKFIEIIK